MEAIKNAHATLLALEARHDLVNGPVALAEATRVLAKATAEALIAAGKPKVRAAPRRAAAKPAPKAKKKR